MALANLAIAERNHARIINNSTAPPHAHPSGVAAAKCEQARRGYSGGRLGLAVGWLLSWGKRLGGSAAHCVVVVLLLSYCCLVVVVAAQALAHLM